VTRDSEGLDEKFRFSASMSALQVCNRMKSRFDLSFIGISSITMGFCEIKTPAAFATRVLLGGAYVSRNKEQLQRRSCKIV
jgi:hypothetical protein